MRIIIALGLFLYGLSASAHHSQSYFSKTFSQIEGEVTKIVWKNPHVRFSLHMIGEDGKPYTQEVETNSLYYLQRAGFDRSRIAIGDTITIGGYASIKAGGDFLAGEILLTDGDNVPLIRKAVTERFEDKVVDAAKDNKGIFRVWSIPQVNDRQYHQPMTEAAKAKQATFDLLDNFTSTCEPVGMPRLMWYPHPYQFIDKGDVIQMRTEMYDSVRTIYMDGRQADPSAPYTLYGHSTGHWDDDNTLIVNTSRIDWEYHDTRGIPQSYAATVHEKFTLSDDQTRLDFTITTTDPLTFTEPATVSAYWLALGESINPYDCTVLDDSVSGDSDE